MKKNKIIMISLLGLLCLVVPFIMIGPTRAQPAHVGTDVGERYEWDQNIYVGALFDTWDEWQADNMTYFWGDPWNQTLAYADMDSIYWTAAGKAGPINPIYIYHYEIDSIVDTTGRTEVNASAGTYTPADLFDYPYERTIYLDNDTAKYAEDCWYGAIATSTYWASYAWSFYASNTMFFAPTNVNWTKFADECNTGMEATYNISSVYGFDLTVSNLTNGYKMHSPIGGFGNNTQNINITVTYNLNGTLTYYGFEYGSNLLVDITPADVNVPNIYDTPADFSVVEGYTGETINWTASDHDPDVYAILRNGSAAVSPTAWYGGVKIEFPVPDGLAVGDHLFRINFADDRGNVVFDEVIMTVTPAPEPIIPGYEPVLVIGIISLAAIGIIIRMKKKK